MMTFLQKIKKFLSDLFDWNANELIGFGIVLLFCLCMIARVAYLENRVNYLQAELALANGRTTIISH